MTQAWGRGKIQPLVKGLRRAVESSVRATAGKHGYYPVIHAGQALRGDGQVEPQCLELSLQLIPYQAVAGNWYQCPLRA